MQNAEITENEKKILTFLFHFLSVLYMECCIPHIIFLENEDIGRVLKIYFERIKKLKDYPKDDRLQRFTERNEKDYMQQAHRILDF